MTLQLGCQDTQQSLHLYLLVDAVAVAVLIETIVYVCVVVGSMIRWNATSLGRSSTVCCGLLVATDDSRSGKIWASSFAAFLPFRCRKQLLSCLSSITRLVFCCLSMIHSVILAIRVLASEIWREGTIVPSLKSPVVDKDGTRPGRWSRSVL